MKNYIINSKQLYNEQFRLIKYTDNYYRYELIKFCRKKGFEDCVKRKSAFSDKENSLKASLSRTKKNIRELCLCNDFEFFYTQTFSKELVDRYSFEDVQSLVRKTFENYKRKNNDFKFLIIYEHHKDSALHVHGLLKGVNDKDLVTNDFNYKTIQYFNDKMGFNSISEIKDYEKCCNYITKYISKDCIKSLHNQIYYCSRGLKKATVINFDYDFVPFNDWDFENDYVKIKDIYKKG